MRPVDRRELQQGLSSLVAVHAGAFTFLVLVLAILERAGLPLWLTGVLVFAALPSTYVVVAAVTATMRADEYFQAGRRVPIAVNGVAGATDWLAGAFYLGLVGAFHTSGTLGLATLAGWTGGLALLALVIGPALARSPAASPAEFLGGRFDSRLLRGMAALAALGVLFPFLAGELALLVRVAGGVLGIGPTAALAFAFGATVFAALTGGHRGHAVGQMLFYGILLLAVLVPALVLAGHLVRTPDPAAALGAAFADRPDTRGTLENAALALAMAIGTAGMPHLLARLRLAGGGAAARRSLLAAFVFVGLVAIVLVGYAMLAGLMLHGAAGGRTLATLPRWVYEFGEHGLISVCGVPATDPAVVSLACGKLHGAGAMLGPTDLAVEPTALAILTPAISGLPFILTALVAVAGIAAVLTTAGALILAAGNTIAEDIVVAFIQPDAPNGRRLFVARLMLLAAAAFGAAGAFAAADVLTLIGWSFGLAAATLAPVLLLAVLWPALTRAGAIAGLVSGAGFVVAYYTVTARGWIEPWSLLGLDEGGLQSAVAGLVFLPVSVAFAVGASLLPDEIRRISAAIGPGDPPAQTSKDPA